MEHLNVKMCILKKNMVTSYVIIKYKCADCYHWIYYEGSIVVLYEMLNCPKWLYEYYKRSIIVLYWMLIVTNGCMSNMKDLSLYYVEGYLSWMFYMSIVKDLFVLYIVINCYKFLCVLWGIYYYIVLNINFHEWLDK